MPSQKKMPIGSDSGNPATGFSDKNLGYIDDAEDIPPELITIKMVVDEFQILICKEGYEMLPDTEGGFGGFRVYKTAQPFTAIPGLQVPQGFTYRKPIQNGTPEAATFTKVATDAFQSMLEAKHKGWHSKIKKVAEGIVDQPRNPKSATFLYALGQVNPNSNPANLSLNGGKGAHKFLPPLSWFPAAVQQVDPLQLLGILPTPEAKQLMLILGRLVCGASGDRVVDMHDSTIEHTFRSFGIMVGFDGGLGKSTFLNWLQETILPLGYTVASGITSDTRFGYGRMAKADLVPIDDLTEQTQKGLMHNPSVKSLVSNGTFFTEEKGVAGQDTKSRAVLLAASNSFNYQDFYGLDPGMISRVNLLWTHTIDELQARYGNAGEQYNNTSWTEGYTKPVWEKLASELKVSVHCLMAYLLRRSADYFLGVAGYELLEDGWYQKTKASTLVAENMLNRSQFRIDTQLGHEQEFLSVNLNAVAFALAYIDKPHYNRTATRLDFNPDLLLATLRLWCSENDFEFAFKDELIPQHLSWDARKRIKAKLSDMGVNHQRRTLSEAFKDITEELRSNKGFTYSSNPARYQSAWMSRRTSLDALVQKWRERIVNQNLPKPLIILAEEVQQVLSSIL
jgi:hypothetical protein